VIPQKRRINNLSHILQIQTEVRDPVAIQAGCGRLKWPEPVFGKSKLFTSSAVGWAVRLPEWRYPVVCGVVTAKIAFDNIGGQSGEQRHLDKLLQTWARPFPSPVLDTCRRKRRDCC
jgi:hypothetical protein